MNPTAGPRLPVSVVGSVGLHVVILALLFAARPKKETTHVISNVDLMVQVRKAVEVPRALPKAPTPPSTWNFLKMALPDAPHISAQQVHMEIPEHHALMAAEPKLQDRGRLNTGPKLQALDMNEHHPKMAAIAEPLAEAHHATNLASLPALEEVGTHRVKNLPEAIKLDDERKQAAALQGLGQFAEGPAGHHAAPAQAAALRDAGGSLGASPSFANKIAAMLPSGGGLDMSRRVVPVGIPKQPVQDQPAVKHKAAKAMMGDDKKGVTIEGPLQDRKVLSYDIPEFPKWARDQGVLEANVSIRFWVDHEGNVLDNMRIEHTSGYGQMDRLAMDSLKNWKFAPLLSDERQWGVITFRFVLE